VAEGVQQPTWTDKQPWSPPSTARDAGIDSLGDGARAREAVEGAEEGPPRLGVAPEGDDRVSAGVALSVGVDELQGGARLRGIDLRVVASVVGDDVDACSGELDGAASLHPAEIAVAVEKKGRRVTLPHGLMVRPFAGTAGRLDLRWLGLRVVEEVLSARVSGTDVVVTLTAVAQVLFVE
jgi:hypothetical protein